MHLFIHTDGGARGNPGPAGFGFVVSDTDKNILFQGSKFLGIKTNNEAEYEGLLAALDWCRHHQTQTNIESVEICMDSELIVKQMKGLYKVKSPHLKQLAQTARHHIHQLGIPVTFTHVFREQNSLADELANHAMDQGF